MLLEFLKLLQNYYSFISITTIATIATIVFLYNRDSSHKNPTFGENTETYLQLEKLYSENPKEYFEVVCNNPTTYLPIIYTPTIGSICLNFSSIHQKFCDLHIVNDLDPKKMRKLIQKIQPSVIVLTDGSRILGLGDLGANGAPIALGKCRVYQALAGIKKVLPLMIDLGTNNQKLLEDDNYCGVKQKRNSPKDILDSIIKVIFEESPEVVLQFEDISLPRCQEWLTRYRYKYRVFNDDIQGTAAVVLAGLINVAKIIKKQPKVLFIGGGSAAQGVAEMWMNSSHGDVDLLWIKDSKGLITKSRNLKGNKATFAREHKETNSIEELVESIQPDVIIGLCAQKDIITKGILDKSDNEQLLVMSLSNPTSCTEITPMDFFTHKPKGLYASGTLFSEYPHNQANNMFIFPVIGKVAPLLGKTIPENLFITAAELLANAVTIGELENGLLYPDNSDIAKTVDGMVSQMLEGSK